MMLGTAMPTLQMQNTIPASPADTHRSVPKWQKQYWNPGHTRTPFIMYDVMFT